MPCDQLKKLSRALHAHRESKLLQDLQNLENMSMKRAVVRFRRGTEEKRNCICGMPGSRTTGHNGRPPVEGDLRQEAGIV